MVDHNAGIRERVAILLVRQTVYSPDASAADGTGPHTSASFRRCFVQPPHRAAADCWLKRSPTPLNDWKSNSHRDGDLPSHPRIRTRRSRAARPAAATKAEEVTAEIAEGRRDGKRRCRRNTTCRLVLLPSSPRSSAVSAVQAFSLWMKSSRRDKNSIVCGAAFSLQQLCAEPG